MYSPKVLYEKEALLFGNIIKILREPLRRLCIICICHVNDRVVTNEWKIETVQEIKEHLEILKNSKKNRYHEFQNWK